MFNPEDAPMTFMWTKDQNPSSLCSPEYYLARVQDRVVDARDWELLFDIINAVQAVLKAKRG